MSEASKPNQLQRWYASLRHKILWKFSKQYRIAIMMIYSVNPNSDMGIITFTSYGPTTPTNGE